MKTILTIFAFFALLNITKAQTVFDGEFRNRVEFRNGYKQLRDSLTTPAGFVTQRTRLAVTHKSEKFQSRINFQDVRVWGDEKLKQDAPSTGISEAWVDYKVADSASLKFGRQYLSYDNQRLLGASNWTQVGQSHDALLLKFKSNDFKLDVGAAFNQVTESNLYGTDYSLNKGNYQTLNFIYLTKKFGAINFTFMDITDGFQKDGTKNTIYLRSTNGVILDYKTKIWGITGRGFYQNGKNVTGQDIAAYFGNIDVNYNIGKMKLLLGVEYWSGSDKTDATNTKENAFNTLYGTAHSLNGSLDFFTNFGDTKGSGLVNPYIYTAYKINDKAALRTDIHAFMLQNNYVDKSGNTLDKSLGYELDLTYVYDVSKEINIMAGYSTILGSESLQTLQREGFSRPAIDKSLFTSWAFVMITIKPTFFNSAPK